MHVCILLYIYMYMCVYMCVCVCLYVHIYNVTCNIFVCVYIYIYNVTCNIYAGDVVVFSLVPGLAGADDERAHQVHFPGDA
jgi:hypothetical protein